MEECLTKICSKCGNLIKKDSSFGFFNKEILCHRCLSEKFIDSYKNEAMKGFSASAKIFAKAFWNISICAIIVTSIFVIFLILALYNLLGLI